MYVKSGVILSGFTMIEMIIALICVSIFVPIIGKCIDVIQFDQSVYVNEMEDIVGIEQLRLYLAKGSIAIDTDYSLKYQTDKEYYVSIVNNHLTLHPGNLVFITDLDMVNFYEIDNSICMQYLKNGEYYDVWIGYK